MADQQPARNAEPRRDDFEINIGEFRLRLNGQAATIIATTGTFAVAGYCVYKVLNNKGLSDCIVHAITKGSVEIDIIAINEGAINSAKKIFSSEDLLNFFNDALQEYSERHNHDIGMYDNVKLVHNDVRKINKDEMLDIKKSAADLKKMEEDWLTTPLKEYVARDFRCIVDDDGNLGEGGFAKVRFSFHDVLGKVALKCFAINGGPREKKILVEQMKHEMETLQRARNNHVVRVYGWTQWNTGMAIVMEYMSAGNLNELLFDPSVQLTPVLCSQFCYDISDGIVFLHNIDRSRRLIHGDLKPQNILVDSKLRCKIGDFGGSHVIKFSTSTTTSAGSFVAKQQLTLLYAAPERLGKTPVRPRKEQDTYSFGLIVHGVLSREHPHQLYSSTEDYLNAVKRGERPDTEEITELRKSSTNDKDKEIIQLLESVMNSCWAHNPHDRANMIGDRDKLESCLNDQSRENVAKSVQIALKKVKTFCPSAKNDYACASLTYFVPVDGKFKSESDVETAMIKRSDSSMAANQQRHISQQGQVAGIQVSDKKSVKIGSDHLLSYAAVTGLQRSEYVPSFGSRLSMDFRAFAEKKYLPQFVEVISNALPSEISKLLSDGKNLMSLTSSRSNDTARVSVNKMKHDTWKFYMENQFNTQLLNRCSEIGWEVHHGVSAFDKNGISFCKKR